MKSFENGSPQVIVGDINSGPALPNAGIEAVRPATYEKFLEKGFHSGNVIQPQPFCTWCPADNNLIPDPEAPAEILDHIFVKNADSNNPKRFWDMEIPFTMGDQQFGLALSDHYASRVTITWPPKGDVGTLLPPRVPRAKPGQLPIAELVESAAPAPVVEVVEESFPAPAKVIQQPQVVERKESTAYKPTYTAPQQPVFVAQPDPVVSTSGSAGLHPSGDKRVASREVFYEGEDPYVKQGNRVAELPEGAVINTTPSKSVFSSLYKTDAYSGGQYNGINQSYSHTHGTGQGQHVHYGDYPQGDVYGDFDDGNYGDY